MRHAIARLCLVALVAAGLPLPAAADQPAPRAEWGDIAMPALYNWPGKIPATPGKVLRHEPMPEAFSLPAAGTAQRMLYVSTDWRTGEPITVSGSLFYPKGVPPRGGWPIMAWAHGTTGVSDVCAPSNRRWTARDWAFLGSWLDKGYAVVATDYQGLGTPGPHPYLLWKSEGLAVLDSARAAVALGAGKLSRDVIAVGFSQGTAAALGAGYLWPRYASELALKGVVASGMVANVGDPQGAPQIEKPKEWTGESWEVATYSALAIIGTWPAIDPSVKASDYLKPKAQPLYEALRTGCLNQGFAAAQNEKIGSHDVFNDRVDKLYDMEKPIYDMPTAHINVPVFVNTGLADKSAGLLSGYNVTSAMCGAGVAVRWRYYPHDTHLSALMRSIPDSLQFAQEVMAGRKIASECSTLRDPGPFDYPEQ